MLLPLPDILPDDLISIDISIKAKAHIYDADYSFVQLNDDYSLDGSPSLIYSLKNEITRLAGITHKKLAGMDQVYIGQEFFELAEELSRFYIECVSQSFTQNIRRVQDSFWASRCTMGQNVELYKEAAVSLSHWTDNLRCEFGKTTLLQTFRYFSNEAKVELVKAMSCLTQSLGKDGSNCFMTHGTLLGTIRDSQLIPHDSDVDLFVLPPEDSDFNLKLSDFSVASQYPRPSACVPEDLGLRQELAIKLECYRSYLMEYLLSEGVC